MLVGLFTLIDAAGIRYAKSYEDVFCRQWIDDEEKPSALLQEIVDIHRSADLGKSVPMGGVGK